MKSKIDYVTKNLFNVVDEFNEHRERNGKTKLDPYLENLTVNTVESPNETYITKFSGKNYDGKIISLEFISRLIPKDSISKEISIGTRIRGTIGEERISERNLIL